MSKMSWFSSSTAEPQRVVLLPVRSKDREKYQSSQIAVVKFEVFSDKRYLPLYPHSDGALHVIKMTISRY